MITHQIESKWTDKKANFVSQEKIGVPMVLYNCSHPSNEKLSVDPSIIPNYDGAYFHRFAWLKDEEVGALSNEWNWLVGWYKEPEDGKPKAIITQKVGPWFKKLSKL